MNDKDLNPSRLPAARETAQEIFARIQRRRGLPGTLPSDGADTPGSPGYATSGGSARAGTSQPGNRQPFTRQTGTPHGPASHGTAAAASASHDAGPDENDLASLRAAMARLHEATQAAGGNNSQASGKTDASSTRGRTSQSSPSRITEPPEPVDIIHHHEFSSQHRLTQSLLVDEDGTPIDEAQLHAERQAHDSQAGAEGNPNTFPRSHTIRTLLRYPTATTAVGVALAIPVATMLLRNQVTRKALLKTGKFLASEEVWKTLKKISKT